MTLDRETGAFRLAGIANDKAAKLSQFISISKNDESSFGSPISDALMMKAGSPKFTSGDSVVNVYDSKSQDYGPSTA